jgi:histidinol-phosphate/aromatic aminotransferase/cobyric acid decarboxylase-like protein
MSRQSELPCRPALHAEQHRRRILDHHARGFLTRIHGVARIQVRAFPDEGLRVSIGSLEENDAFLASARDFTTSRLTSSSGEDRWTA